MNDLDAQKMLENAWRRPLSTREQEALAQWLAGHPQSRASFEEDLALTKLLQGLPATPISSNFTARALNAARAASTPRSNPWSLWFPAGWLPRLALVVGMLTSGTLSFHGYEVVHRMHLARDVARVSQVASLPPVGWLEDFDTINRLNKVKVADDDLLTTLE